MGAHRARLVSLAAAALAACQSLPALEPARVLQALREAKPVSRPEGALSAEQAVTVALENSPALAPYRRSREVALGELAASTDVANPTVQIAKTAFNSAIRDGWQLSLRWFPPRPFELFARRAGARARVEESEFELAEQELQLAAAVRDEHLDVRSLDRELGLLERGARDRRAVLALIERRTAQGVGTRVDVEAARAAVAEAERDLSNVRRDRAKAHERLRSLLALPTGTELELSGADDEVRELPPAAALEVWALEARPRLKAMQAQYAQRTQDVRLAEQERYPWFRIIAGPRLHLQPVRDRADFDVGVELSFPVWNWNTGKIAAERARLDQQSDRYTAELARVRADIAAQLAELSGQQQALRVYDDQLLPALKQRVEAARAALQLQQLDAVHLLLAQDALLQAERARERAVRSLLHAWIALERAVGRPKAGAP